MGTALMAAAFKGHKNIVNRLLAGGAKVNDRNGIGATALMFASMTGRFEVVRILMNHKADVNVRDERGAVREQFGGTTRKRPNGANVEGQAFERGSKVGLSSFERPFPLSRFVPFANSEAQGALH